MPRTLTLTGLVHSAMSCLSSTDPSTLDPSSVFLIDRDVVSLTIAWPPVPHAVSYHIQMKTGPSMFSPDAINSKDTSDWADLAKSFASTQVKKKNLSPSTSYIFRVRGRDSVDFFSWSSPSPAYSVEPPSPSSTPISSTPEEKAGAPQAGAITTAWSPVGGAIRYEVYMRVEGEPFALLGAVGSCEVRKKNLVEGNSYYFKTRAVLGDDSAAPAEFSRSSPALKPGVALTVFTAHLFRGLGTPLKLLAHSPSGDALSPLTSHLSPGKLTLLYFSASWCGPCRNFTPKLVEFYNTYKKTGNFEVVFVSCDHDEEGFTSYYSHMPWPACPYEEGGSRERILGEFKVSGIPALKVLGPDGGVIEENAVQMPLEEKTAPFWWGKVKK